MAFSFSMKAQPRLRYKWKVYLFIKYNDLFFFFVFLRESTMICCYSAQFMFMLKWIKECDREIFEFSESVIPSFIDTVFF